MQEWVQTEDCSGWRPVPQSVFLTWPYSVNWPNTV